MDNKIQHNEPLRFAGNIERFQAPDIRELDMQFHRAINALFVPAISIVQRLTIRQFNKHMQEIIEAELANRNIEYAQALIDNAQ